MIDTSIIGAGRLGTTLGAALRKTGYHIIALSCKGLSSAKESRKVIGEGNPLSDNIEAAKKAKLLFLCVPDSELKKVTKELSQSDIDWSKKYVFHTSGLLSTKALNPLKGKGALTASLHPVQSFPQKMADQKKFEGIYFGLEGCPEALTLGRKIVHQLGGSAFILQAEDKPLYHAACSIASNFLVVLLYMATSILREIGFKEDPFQILFPLVQGTLHNVKKFDISGSLTGPVVRGDQDSVEKHLRSLRTLPRYRKIYTALASQALEIARREKRLMSQDIEALKNLLEEK